MRQHIVHVSRVRGWLFGEDQALQSLMHEHGRDALKRLDLLGTKQEKSNV